MMIQLEPIVQLPFTMIFMVQVIEVFNEFVLILAWVNVQQKPIITNKILQLLLLFLNHSRIVLQNRLLIRFLAINAFIIVFIIFIISFIIVQFLVFQQLVIFQVLYQFFLQLYALSYLLRSLVFFPIQVQEPFLLALELVKLFQLHAFTTYAILLLTISCLHYVQMDLQVFS